MTLRLSLSKQTITSSSPINILLRELISKLIRKQKDPLKPKHPISAFLVYANERRAALRYENKKVVEVAKMTGEEWKNMSDRQKAPYEENKEIYLEAMVEYERTKEEETMSQKTEDEELLKLHKQEALQLFKKKEKTDNLIKKKKETKKKKNENVDPNKPKKPVFSLFLFSKDTRKNLTEERPGINNSTITALMLRYSCKFGVLACSQLDNGTRSAAMDPVK